jgi:hypothetical protein
MEVFYFIDWFLSTGLHSDRCASCCKVHMNFANESACLMAKSIWNEGK